MRLIDADALEPEISRLCPSMSQPDGTGCGDDLVLATQDMLIDVLQTIHDTPAVIPPADAEPVQHGWWETAIGYDPARKFQCSQCHRMAYEPSAFCPHCGVKMDKREGKQ